MAMPEMPEFEIHPKDPSKTYGFKDFAPRPVGRVMPFDYDEEEGATALPEVDSPDPKASDAPASASSSEIDSDVILNPEEVVAKMKSEPLPKQPLPSTPALPSTPPALAGKEATKSGS